MLYDPWFIAIIGGVIASVLGGVVLAAMGKLSFEGNSSPIAIVAKLGLFIFASVIMAPVILGMPLPALGRIGLLVFGEAFLLVILLSA